ncbi:MAG TPA: TMEM175 family protein, partial [Lentzea sp.]
MREGDELGAGSGLSRDERRRDPSRVLALTDGVYAIIITLLVLDIKVPDLSGHETLGTAFTDVRPSFIAFTIAFIVAAMQWVGHRDLFTLIRDTDRGIVWLNLLTLFTACLLPFGSALVSRYHQDPLALRMFGLILMATSLSRSAIWVYATLRPSVIHDPIDRASFWSGLALSVFPLVIYVAAFAIAGVSTGASLAVYA